MEQVVIIGGSIAGIYATTALIRNGFDGQVTIIDKKDVYPYNTYPLSKEWMADEDEMDPPLLKSKEYYEKHHIRLKLNTKAESINWKDKIVTTNLNEKIPYDHLIIATGSKLRELTINGEDAQGVFYLREFNDAKAIKKWAKKSDHVAIIGSGFIGLELAATFTQMEKNVSVLVRSGKPLEKVFGKEVSDYFIDMHESHGVNFIFNEEAKEFKKDEAGKITSILTKSGKKVPCELAIISVGVEPNLSFQMDSLAINYGIIVNEYGETSLPNVYAAGDVVEWPYKDRLIHVEHWENAWSQGTSIAKNIINEKSSAYHVTPYFWTDQYDQTFEYLGEAKKWHKTIVRGTIETGKFAVAYVDENNYPLAILFANKFEERKDVERLLAMNQTLDESQFTDVNRALVIDGDRSSHP